MRPNIFLYKNFVNEDHFTNSLGYILNLFPSELGNRFLTKISCLAGYPIDYFGKFKEARFTGHNKQNPDSISKPDMIISTEKAEIFLEIKLKAGLSENQLGRHFKDVDRAKGFLLLISNVRAQIPIDIQKRKNYVKPKLQNHFFWSDFESVFDLKFRRGVLEDRLLEDFKRSLSYNGIKGRQILGADDNLYTNGSDAEKLVLDELKIILKKIGFSAWRLERDFTLRVNPHKRGVDPLLNPRLYSSGEWLDDSCSRECIIIHCFSKLSERKAAKRIYNLKDLELSYSDVRWFEGVSDEYLRVFIYLPLTFSLEGGSHRIDWNPIIKICSSIYDIVK